MTAVYLCANCGEFHKEVGANVPGKIKCPRGCNFYAVFDRMDDKRSPKFGCTFSGEGFKQNTPHYDAWYHSEETQRKIRTGEYVHPRKSDDIRHR